MPMDEGKNRVLVIDDDEAFRERLSRALARRGWAAHAAANGVEALAFLTETAVDLALVDMRMPGMHGLDVVERLRAVDAAMKVIVLTGYGSIPTTIAAIKRGADDYLSKPVDADQILAAYEKLMGADEAALAMPESAPSLARVEWEHMQRVIEDCGGNISQAARILGIHRRSLQRKLSKYPPTR